MNRKVMFRFYTIADYLEEEKFLRKQHQNGYRFVKIILPGIYVFEKCLKEDVIYQLDFYDGKQSDLDSYMKMFNDCGWEYCGDCSDWKYFRKKAEGCQDISIFSDRQSKIDLIDRVLKRRLLPLLVIFSCIVIPQFFQSFVRIQTGDLSILSWSFLGIFCSLFVLYLWICLHCGLKLLRLKKEMEGA